MSNTTVQAPGIANETIAVQTSAIGQNADGYVLNQRAANAFGSDQIKKVRTVSIRDEAAAANTAATQSSPTAQSEHTFATLRAHPNADASPELAAASSSAAAFADPRSVPIPFPAPRAGTDVREQRKVLEMGSRRREGGARP